MCKAASPQLSPVLQSCGQAFPARQAASHTGKQTGRASELYSQHPHPRTFKLLKPAHHSAASLPQLLFISLENVMLWLRAGCYWGQAFHASSWSQPATAMPNVQSDCKPSFARHFCETLSLLYVAASPHVFSCGRQQAALCAGPCARQALSSSTRCSSYLKTTILPFCWVGRCITLLVEKTEILNFDSECRDTMWPV